MSTGKKALIGVGLLLVVGAVVAANVMKRDKKGVAVTMYEVKREDIVARVSCTGKTQAKRKVDISANVMGQIVNLAVREGDRVEKDQFLLQIDRTQLQAQASGSEAALAALLAEREASRSNAEQAQRDFERAEKNYSERIVPQAEFQRVRSGLEGARAALSASERRIEQARAALQMSRDTLSKTTIRSPIAGIVTALPVEEGEVAVIGTMNNPGTKLMTVSDMSEVEAEMEVDETDVPRVKVGQKAALTVDALPEQEFVGHVSEIGSSPIARLSGASSAVEFSVKIVFEAPPETLRPGFSVSARIETGERLAVVALPIQALVVQDLAEKLKKSETKASESTRSMEMKTGNSKDASDKKEKDIEGVYLMDGTKAKFVAVKTGLQGELKVEVTEGLKEGDRIITGPFRALRSLKDGDAVRLEEKKDKDTGAKQG